MMDTIFRNENGKFSTAVYLVRKRLDTVSLPELQDTIAKALGSAYGRTTSVFGLNVAPGGKKEPAVCVEFYVLVANERQTTRADLVKDYAAIGWDDVEVQVVAGVSQRGSREYSGSPRAGTKRELKNATHASVKTSR